MRKISGILLAFAFCFCIAGTSFAGELIVTDEETQETVGGSETVADYIASYDLASLEKEWADVIAELKESGADEVVIEETNQEYKTLMIYAGNAIYDYLVEHTEKHIEAMKVDVPMYFQTITEALNNIATWWADTAKYIDDLGLDTDEKSDITDGFETIEIYLGNASYDYMNAGLME